MKLLETRQNLRPIADHDQSETQLIDLAASIVKLEKEIKWRTEDLDALKRKTLDLLGIGEGKVQHGVFVFSVSHYKRVLINYWRKPFTSLRVRKLTHRPGGRVVPAALLLLALCLPALADKTTVIRRPVRITSFRALPVRREPVRTPVPVHFTNSTNGVPRATTPMPGPAPVGIPYRPLPGANP